MELHQGWTKSYISVWNWIAKSIPSHPVSKVIQLKKGSQSSYFSMQALVRYHFFLFPEVQFLMFVLCSFCYFKVLWESPSDLISHLLIHTCKHHLSSCISSCLVYSFTKLLDRLKWIFTGKNQVNLDDMAADLETGKPMFSSCETHCMGLEDTYYCFGEMLFSIS